MSEGTAVGAGTNRRFRAVRLVGWACVSSALAWSAAAAGELDTGVLHLPGGGTLPGRLLPAGAAAEGGRATLLWKSPAFAAPFEFRINAIAGLRFTAARPAAAAAAFRCLLRGGDAIDGDIDALDREHLLLATGGGKRLRIDTAVIESIARLDANHATAYVGPNGLAGWEQSPAASWQEDGQRIRSSSRNASVFRDLGSPDRACIDLVITWKKMPEFRIGIGGAAQGGDDAFRIEFLQVDGQPAAGLVRKEKADARIALLDIGKPADRLHLRLFVDHRAGRLAGTAIGGGPPAFSEVILPPPPGRASGRFRLTLDAGDVSIDSLRVSAWTTPDPVVEERSSAAVTDRDGRTVAGSVVMFDKATGELELEGGRKLKLSAVDGIVFRPAAPGSVEAGAAPLDGIRVMRQAGAMLSGGLVSIDETTVRLACRGIEEPVDVPLGEVTAIVPTRTEAAAPPPGRLGRLNLGEVAIQGCLVDGAGIGAAVAWMPVGSVNASPLVESRDAPPSAVLEYVPRPARAARPKPLVDGSDVELGGIGGVVNPDTQGNFVVAMLSEDGAAALDGRLQADDRLLAIKPLANGRFVPLKGLDLQDVMNLLRGRVGTPVVLRVDSAAGGDVREIDLTRGRIFIGDRIMLDEALATHTRLAGEERVAAAAQPEFPADLILTSGDVVPARIVSIDARGLRVLSPVADAAGEPTVVDPRLVKAVELDPAAESREIDRVRADRMLMLPRSQRASPPTHMVRLRDGDYIRGRLVRLDDTTLVVEVRGEVKKLPRDSVVRIIWLHPEEGDAQAPGGDAEPGPRAEQGLMVQGVARGRRMTLVAEGIEGSTIRGISPAFGAGQIDLDQIDWLLIGGAIAAEADDLPYGQWKLRPAPEPRALRQDPAEPGPKI